MKRRPFDPGAAAGAPDAPDSPDSPNPGAAASARAGGNGRAPSDAISVAEAVGLIKRTLENGLPSTLKVLGEIGNLSTPNHWYFSLKDGDAVLHCVAWASQARSFGFRPEPGTEVVASGHVSHFEAQGRTQLYVRTLKPVGTGALEAKFRALCERLRSRGYFEDGRKRPLPPYPRRVALVTSATGAAVHDVLTTARSRWPAVRFLLVDVRVQGDGAAEEIARALDRLDRHRARLGIDAVVVTRGGGSLEDLWAFNEAVVAEAIFNCSVPVVAAIGHESDTTVAELVADRRASTPTQAAMVLVPDAADLRRQVEHHRHRLRVLLDRRLDRSRERFRHAARHEAFREPGRVFRHARHRLDTLAMRLHHVAYERFCDEKLRLQDLLGRLENVRPSRVADRRRERLAVLAHRLERALAARVDCAADLDRHERTLAFSTRRLLRHRRERLDGLARQLQAVDARRVLRRGFSYTTLPDGTLVKTTEDVRGGETLHTHLVDGVVRSRVDGGRRSGRRKTSRDAPRVQMDLFRADD